MPEMVAVKTSGNAAASMGGENKDRENASKDDLLTNDIPIELTDYTIKCKAFLLDL